MQIIEVKNNLVQLNYDSAQEKPVLSGFIVLKDLKQSFIAQIIHLESNIEGNLIIAKLLFIFDAEGVISNYDGSIPSANSYIDFVQASELLELLPIQYPIALGEVSQQKTMLNLDRSFLEENLLISSDKNSDSNLFIENMCSQLTQQNKKVLVFDFSGDFNFSQNKLTAGEDLKLPLNYETINFIYEKELDDATAQSRALIQDIFLEVQDYIKTLPENFIPFNSFKTVVDEQYKETNLIDLVLLKNKLLKLQNNGVFAQSASEFNSLDLSLKHNLPTIVDLSSIEEKLQREFISFAYNILEKNEENIYVFIKLENYFSDKKLLKQIFTNKKTFTNALCAYSFKYLTELKQLAKNIVFFAPIVKQNDFAGYNSFVNKLNPAEFVVYGRSTHHLPLIVSLTPISQNETTTPEAPEKEDLCYTEMLVNQVIEPLFEEIETNREINVDEEIRKDVDSIYTTPKKTSLYVDEATPELETSETIEDVLTEDDLDFIDDLNIIQTEDSLTEELSNNSSAEENIASLDEIGNQEENIFEDLLDEAELLENKEEASFDDTEEIPENLSSENSFDELLNTENSFSSGEELVLEETCDDNTKEADITPIQTSLLDESLNSFQEDPITESASTMDILPAEASSTPIVPIFSADIEPTVDAQIFEQGDVVSHPKYGKGSVEKLITYGNKTLCSINFDNVGRRLLDPSIVELNKI